MKSGEIRELVDFYQKNHKEAIDRRMKNKQIVDLISYLGYAMDNRVISQFADFISTKSSTANIIADECLEKIKELRSKCDHVFEYEGHDSHKDYYKCIHCDEKDSR